MAVGTVRDFNPDRGYGFITGECGKHIFVHHSHIVMDGYRTLEPGTPVEFMVERTESGRLQAVNVRPL